MSYHTVDKMLISL